jgi:hypothetical protein
VIEDRPPATRSGGPYTRHAVEIGTISVTATQFITT